ncbi:lysosome membrane protein 2-like [Diadema setosum]|uniref:lysosome membrane protein 2-like n=1 Tax=Diadema setosum TaxID=31175 RepID=UPI003B3B1F29
MKRKTKTCLLATIGVVGAIIAAIGGALLHFYPVIFDELLLEKTRLVKGTMGYANWKNPPADIHLDFYVWHLENPLEVEKGHKPNVSQRGPYTYRESREKVDVVKHDNGTLSYVQPLSFVVDPDSEYDPMADNITTLNIPLLTVIDQLQFMPELVQYLFNELAELFIKHIHSTHTVHDFIWGYFSPLLAVAKILKPDKVPKDHFGIYVDRNNSNDGVYTVFDGVKDHTKTSSINTWKGMDSLPYWTTKYGNMLNGTDGTYFGQLLSKEDSLYIFVSDICRSVKTTFHKETVTRDNPTWRFTVPSSVFQNVSANPDNVAFCTPDETHCLPGGLLNISLCQFGAPIYFSLPHFLHADPEVLEMVNGVHPDRDLHETFIDVEPYTGAPLNISKRSQINTHLRPYHFIDFYRHVPEAYVPLVWMNERSEVTKEAAQQIRNQLRAPLAVGKYVPWSALALGLFVVLLAVVCLGCLWRKDKESLHVQGNENANYEYNASESGRLLM